MRRRRAVSGPCSSGERAWNALNASIKRAFNASQGAAAMNNASSASGTACVPCGNASAAAGMPLRCSSSERRKPLGACASKPSIRTGFEHRMQRIEPCAPLGRAPLSCGPERIEHAPAAHRAARLRVAHDEAIAGQRAHRFVEHELHARGSAGSERVAIEQRDMRDLMRRAEMHMQRRPVHEIEVRIGQQREFGIDALRRRAEPRIDDPVAARDRILVDAREIQRATLARAARLRRRDSARGCCARARVCPPARAASYRRRSRVPRTPCP